MKRFKIAAILSLALLLMSTPVLAYTHHKSKIRWMEYSQEAFERAKRENKPIYMLITAVWCFWCQVFEEKTLEKTEVANYLNENFVNIFVDYDKRKDIASKYPPTGLPFTVIFAPDGTELVSVPGYIEKDKFLENLRKTVAYVKELKPQEKRKEEKVVEARGLIYPKVDDLETLVTSIKNIIRDNYDKVYGGFGFREKVPYADTLDFLMDLYNEEGKELWLEMVTNTLDHIGGLKKGQDREGGKRPESSYILALYREREGEDWLEKVGRLQREDRLYGLYDPVEGGFFRYALLRDWSMPHFEKMLRENGEIIKAYLRAYTITGRVEYRDLALGGLRYVLNKLYDREGFFYGSQVADEVYYHLGPEERKKVKPPIVDRTGYTLPNAKMVMTLIEAWKVLKEERYRKIAEKVLDFWKDKMLTNWGVLSYYDPQKGKGELNGLLSDNAWMALAYLKAYEAFKEDKYLEVAQRILDFLITNLYDTSNGGFFERRSTSREFYREEELFSPAKPYVANGVAAYALILAYRFTGNDGYEYKARETIGAFLKEYPDASQPYMERAAMALLKIENKKERR